MEMTRDKIIEYMNQDSYRPARYQELKDALGVEDETDFQAILGQMEQDGDIVVNRKQKYGIPEMMNLVRGILQVNPKKFAFLQPDNPELVDIHIFGSDLNGAMHRDKVMVRVNNRPQGQKPEGEVVRIISRANQTVVGTYRKSKNAAQVVPDDPRLYTPIITRAGAKIKVQDGQKVVVRITVWPERDNYPEGQITEVLGNPGDPGVDVMCIVKKYGLSEVFPGKVLQEAESTSMSVLPEEIKGRRDLRDLPMVTIDGEDAKDLDDAVSLVKLENGFRLGVHIADVSHYVRESTPLDGEAYQRGTSVYLVDRVLPMLPPSLSNGICSLNAGEDRLAMTAMIDMDQQGEILSYEIYKSVIHVAERMTYTAVNAILKDQEPGLMERYKEYVPMFSEMHELASILRKRRFDRGALDFDFPEIKVILDEQGIPIAIKKRRQDLAESLIEEFMIRANEVVATHCNKLDLPTLYRVHERPDDTDLVNVVRMLAMFNVRTVMGTVTPELLNGILRDVKGKPEQRIISTLILRSMKHARYAPVALGHFGLASPYYLHFTSPIRRYPDLLVHRVLTEVLAKGALSGQKKTTWEKFMPVAGEQCTQREIQAEEAERDSVDMKAAQFMAQFVGDTFPAVISSVTSFGFFVELENGVEGLVHISSLLDDYYIFDEKKLILMGRNTRKLYRIGDEVEVDLVKVNADEAKIDFELTRFRGSNA